MGLNKIISQLEQDKKNIMKSQFVKDLIQKKDSEIKELFALVD